MAIKFREVRLKAQKHWLSSTQRKRYINDVVYSAFECHWQNNYVSTGMHNSFFCSMGEWNTHITDLLFENNYDSYDFVTPRYNKALFRFYTRFLLVTSEIMTDFQDFIMHIKKIKQDDARNLLDRTVPVFTTQELFDYINNICKHKHGDPAKSKHHKYHRINHHIDYYFRDSYVRPTFPVININNYKSITLTGKEQVEVPKLIDIIDQIIWGYGIIDILLRSANNTLTNNLKQYYEKRL